MVILSIKFIIILISVHQWFIVFFFFWDIYLSLGISLSFSFVTISELFCCEFLESFVSLPSYDLGTASVILLPIKISVASAVFLIALFEAVLNSSVADCLAWSRGFWLFYHSTLYLYFYKDIYAYFYQKTKIHNLYVELNISSLFVWNN